MNQPVLDSTTLRTKLPRGHKFRRVGSADRPDITGIGQPIAGSGDEKGYPRLGKPIPAITHVTPAGDLLQAIAETVQLGVQLREPQVFAKLPVPIHQFVDDRDARQAMRLHGEACRPPNVGLSALT